MITRRTFAASSLALPLFGKAVPFKLGVASYSLRELPRAEAIAGIKKLDVQYVSVKEFHIRYTSTPEEIAAARREFADAGLKILSGGNIDLKGDDAKLRKMFEYAKACGMPLMVCAPSHATLPQVEKLAKEFNIRLAIHNHGPEDKEFPTPQSVLDAIKGMNSHVGLCIDVGHTARTGADVVESIQLALKAGRLYDMHLKDLKDMKVSKSQCIVGQGRMPIRDIFATLQKAGYKGSCMLEYEIDAKNPLPGMTKSFEYMRKVIAALEI